MFVLYFPEELIRKNSNKQKYGFLQLNATSVPLRASRGIKLSKNAFRQSDDENEIFVEQFF